MHYFLAVLILIGVFSSGVLFIFWFERELFISLPLSTVILLSASCSGFIFAINLNICSFTLPATKTGKESLDGTIIYALFMSAGITIIVFSAALLQGFFENVSTKRALEIMIYGNIAFHILFLLVAYSFRRLSTSPNH